MKSATKETRASLDIYKFLLLASLNFDSDTDDADRGKRRWRVPTSTSVPLPSIQARLLPDPYCPAPGDTWEYAISKAWLNKWSKLGALTQSQRSLSPSSDLGPITVHQTDVENCYIAESVWNVLLSWNKKDGASLMRRRHFNPGYMPLVTEANQQIHTVADKYLDILMVNLCSLTSLDVPEKHDILQIYAWDTADFWEEQIKTKVAFSASCETRLWLIVQHKEVENCIQIPKGSHGSILQFVSRACPSLVNFLVDRGNKYPAPEHQSAFSSFHSSTSSGKLSLTDLQNTKSYLFQDLLLEKCKITIAVESVVPSTPGLGFLAGSLSSIISCSSTSSDSSSDDESIPPWQERLKKVLDEISGSMHTAVNNQRELVEVVSKAVVNDVVAASKQLNEELQAKMSENESKAASLAAQEKDLSERESGLNEKLQKFKIGLADFLVQKKRLEDELKKIEQLNKIAESKIKLNVGGHKFETSLETVTKDPYSTLGVMFSGRHSIKQEPDGAYFIDRDGTNFRYILNFLRDGEGSYTTMPAEVKSLRELQKEAEFYKLNGLIDFLKMKIGP